MAALHRERATASRARARGDISPQGCGPRTRPWLRLPRTVYLSGRDPQPLRRGDVPSRLPEHGSRRATRPGQQGCCRPGGLSGVSAGLSGEPARGQMGGLQDRPSRHSEQLFSASGRGGLPPRLEWIGDDLLLSLQSTLRLLSELRHQPGCETGPRPARIDTRGDRRHDARPAAAGLSQRQLRHA